MTDLHQNTSQQDIQNPEFLNPGLSRRQFVAMGAGAAMAYVLPRSNALAQTVEDTCPPPATLCPTCPTTISCDFPQPPAGFLGSASDPTPLAVKGQVTSVKVKSNDPSSPDYLIYDQTSSVTQDLVTTRFYSSDCSDANFTPTFADPTQLTPGDKVFQPGPTFRFQPTDSSNNQLNLNFVNTMVLNDNPELGIQGIPGIAGAGDNIPDPYVSSGCDGSIDRPRCLSTNNLHFHGLHVSPISLDTTDPATGQPVYGPHSDAQLSSDDMLFELPPNATGDASHRYCVKLPEFHAPGTHWYHAHTHGSTAIHIVDGIAGALILEEQEGVNKITVDEDLVWLLQETLFPPPTGTSDYPTITKIRQSNSDLQDNAPEYPVPSDQTVYGCIGGFGSAGFTVNGIYQPTLTVQPGKLLRWRFINGTATPRGFVRLSLYRFCDLSVLDDCTKYESLMAGADLSNAQVQTMYLIATDGINFFGKPPRPVNYIDLVAANRADFLVQLTEPGVYWVMKEQLPSGAGQRSKPNKAGGTPTVGPTQVLATVVVTGTAIPREQQTQIPATIPGTAPNYLQPITSDQLLTYVDTETAGSPTVPYLRPVVFNIPDEFTGLGCGGYATGTNNDIFPPLPRGFAVNDRGYTGLYGSDYISYTPPATTPNATYYNETHGTYTENTQRWDTVQVVKLNTCEEWIIFNYSRLTHPFHIHVNPFQVVEIYTPNADNVDTPICQQFNVEDAQWWDTFGIPPAQYDSDSNLVEPGYIRIRSRFWDYWGEYVFHCHILIHEDLGMMQNVFVVPDPENADPKKRGYNPCTPVSLSGSAIPGPSGEIDPSSSSFFYPAPMPVTADGCLDKDSPNYFNPFYQISQGNNSVNDTVLYPCQYSIPEVTIPLNPPSSSNTKTIPAEPQQSADEQIHCASVSGWPEPVEVACEPGVNCDLGNDSP